MIVLEVDSGLGNQMFMYAAAKALANRHQTRLYLDVDIACIEGYGIGQSFQLDRFNISSSLADRSILDYFAAEKFHEAFYEKFRSRLRESRAIRNLASLLRGKGINISKALPVGNKDQKKIFEEPEDDWSYKPEFLNLPDNLYLKGYFPSHRYFSEIRDVILQEFTLRVPLSERCRELEERILATNSVSIHFRRGDVTTDPRYKKWYEGVVTDDYYRNALDYLSSRFNNLEFFVFSNEIEWVKQNFKLPGRVTCVDHNGPDRGFEDLHLMSRCKHNVTAGCSSFSWWAGYLNPNPGKVVIRTRRVTPIPQMDFPEDFFPKEWVIAESTRDYVQEV